MKYTLLKSILAFVGTAISLGIFWGVCRLCGWDAPAWAYFIVGWIGHNDFYDALTYKKDEALND